MATALPEIAFHDRTRAKLEWGRVSGALPPPVQERLASLLKGSADPDASLRYLIQLHDSAPDGFASFAGSAAGLQALIAVFSCSRFLADEVIRQPEWLEGLLRSGDLYRGFGAEDYETRLTAALARYEAGSAPSEAFAAFRREQLLRILLRDLLGYAPVAEVAGEISCLADAILNGVYRQLRDHLAARHGNPPGTLSIVALGKLGGSELNYSSDIDLMFVYDGGGDTDGEEPIPVREFYRKLCIALNDLLSAYTQHGVCYRVDLRLRPEGTLGEICLSLDQARQYYRARARDWELQMLIKARVAAGDREPGLALLDFVEPLTYSSTLDFSKVEAVSEARLRISEKLARRRGSKQDFDIKLAPGGIRDIEFLVQCLQRLHGGKEPWLRHGGTLHALIRLRDKDLLSEIEYGRLASAYQFLRTLEHRLQVLEDRQVHSLPGSARELEVLARRMPAAALGEAPSAAALQRQLDHHLAQVRDIYARVVHTRLPLHYSNDFRYRDEPITIEVVERFAPEPMSVNLGLMLTQRAPRMAETLSRSQLRYGARAFEHFLEHMPHTPQWLQALDEDAVLTGYLLDIFEHSPFLAEQLNRHPELVEEVREMRLKPESQTRYDEMPGMLTDAASLRRFFNREMLRIQADSICLRRPIFETLARTSALADCAVAAAYGMALEQVMAAQGPVNARYDPAGRMMVVALGRLGMQEFDLASDADLVFVLPDDDSAEMVFWTRVAERMVELLTAYTGEGVLFAVDTRLRPNGREGPLVQTVGAFRDYFTRTAQAWEGITYMKSRTVAGHLERGTHFLEGLQDVDWRRYGQGGRSKEKLRQMRLRLENEQGRANPLKAGRGGYYDIDFALMFLRLRSAGFFFKVLNTPARVDIIEKMGHLDRPDAQFLLDAATFYRAVDHALRLVSGHAEGRLPNAEMQLERLSELVGRWTPRHLCDQPLPDELERIQDRTREFFERLFG